MVRNIASALRDIGRDHDVESMASRLGRRDRRKLGITAPPQGLYLVQVAYPEQAFPESPQPSFLPDY
jgi:tRNA pseudouridine38-40 synthase